MLRVWMRNSVRKSYISWCRPVCLGLLAIGLSTGIAACSNTPDLEELTANEDDTGLWELAQQEAESGDWQEAVRLYEELERRFPYSPYANPAQFAVGRIYYEQGEFNQAILSFDRFIQLHPADEKTPEAYYLRALSFYDQISDVARDQAMTLAAQRALQQTLNRYPESGFAQDVRLKLDLTYDQLAGKEMSIGRWYQRRGNFHAAINRYTTVIEDYETTAHIPEALLRMVESYVALGLLQEAQRVAAVLGHNYPETEWYADAYALVQSAAPNPQ